MPNLPIPEPLTVVSPHLDDAVFSCGALIAAASEAVVVTVMAGVPAAEAELPDWDRAAGFATAEQAVTQRRREDARALGMLSARPEWLSFFDSQYGKHHEADDIMTALSSAAALQRGGTVAAPMGLFHSDHMLVSHACMLLRGSLLQQDTTADAAPPLHWILYEDAIYRRLPGMVQSRLLGWWQAGLVASPVHFPTAPWQALKMAAVEAYESQLPLFNAGQLADIGAPERYWSVDIVPAPGH